MKLKEASPDRHAYNFENELATARRNFEAEI